MNQLSNEWRGGLPRIWQGRRRSNAQRENWRRFGIIDVSQFLNAGRRVISGNGVSAHAEPVIDGVVGGRTPWSHSRALSQRLEASKCCEPRASGPSPNRSRSTPCGILAALQAFALVGGFLFSWVAMGAAQGVQTNVIDQIQGIEETKKATVVLLPPSYLVEPAGVTEATLGALGCHYVSIDSSRIRRLIDILKQADLLGVEPTEAGWMNEPREGVALELSDGTRIVFIFTIKFINQGVRGYFYRLPRSSGPSYLTDADPPLLSYFTAKPSLPNELITWAVGTGASIPRDLQPDAAQEIQQTCDYFVKMGETLR
jgi:hypothetical protein